MRIVVVDPSRTVLKIVTQLLEARGHTVRTFTDGREALNQITADHDVDAFITSTELPCMPGAELCRQVRALANDGRPIYVVLMSSNYDRSKLIEALSSGADDFIGKPPAIEELYARLRTAERLGDMQRKLYKLAMTDPLTGALNRRAFFEKAQDACTRAEANGGPLSAILFDIDHFKYINDDYGHDVGDRVLRVIAGEVTAEKLLLGRLGGEEFVVLLEGVNEEDAVQVAERLRLRFAGLQLDADGKPVKFTASFGVSQRTPGDTIDDVLKRADVALYQAKENGRNRVVLFGPQVLRLARGMAEGPVRAQARAR
jgi:two-component system, cell cycle response regulator